MIQTVERNHLGGISRTSISYNFVGNVLISYESHQTSSTATADTKKTTFTYDNRGRLLSETTVVNGASAGTATVTYAYNDLGQLISRTKGGVTETLAYNIQGWQTSQSSTLFDSQLRYFDPRSGSSKGRWTGDIAELRWQHKGSNAPTSTPANSYEFAYDKLGRLTANDHKGASTISATSWSTPARTFTESGITYDKNGNITKLTRAGYHATSGSTSLLTDNLTYTNTGNRLTTLSHNNATGSVKASGSYAYSYDTYGNMTRNARENLDYGYNSLFGLRI